MTEKCFNQTEADERHGETPTLVACDNEEQEVSHIRAAIRAFQESDHNSLGIICETQQQADSLHEKLAGGRERVHLLDAGSTAFSRGAVIATAYLAKGLEFDQVIVPFCRDSEFKTVIDRHMLYVGCTRAMHALSLTHTAKPSPLLENALRQSKLVARRAEAGCA